MKAKYAVDLSPIVYWVVKVFVVLQLRMSRIGSKCLRSPLNCLLNVGYEKTSFKVLPDLVN